MAVYTIRPGFTVRLGNTIYFGGETVDLTLEQFALNKHKLEGTEGNSSPVNPQDPQGTIEISDLVADLLPGDSGSAQEFIDALDSRLDIVYGSIFGAKGDGISDDTAAIQAALDAAGQALQSKQNLGLSGRAIVRLRGGTYKISSTLIVRNGTSLIGETLAPPYPNRLSGFKSNDNLFTGTEIICSQDFVGEEAILLEPDNTNVEQIILDGHAVPCGTTWTQINITTAQGRWISSSFIKFPVQDDSDLRIQSLGFDNIEIPYFQIGKYSEFQLQGIGGGEGTYTFEILAGNLPQGLSLNTSGLISGTPTELETVYPVFRLTSTVSSSEEESGSGSSSGFSSEIITTKERTFIVGTVLDEIETGEILPPTVGANYSFELKTLQGEADLTWKGIDLPDWLDLNSTTGILTNNRTTTADDVEFFNFKVELYSDSNLIDKRAYKSELRYADGAIRIFGEQRLKPEAGVAFSYQYLGHGGYGDYTWSISENRSQVAGNATAVSATSPYEGLSLDPVTGTISGTVTTTGTNTYYLRATSNSDNSIFFEGLFYIEAIEAGETPRIITRSFATAVKGQPYSFQFKVEDIPSAQPYNYTAINLPTGLTMDANGLVTGTPTGANFVHGVRLQWSDSVKSCTIRGFRSGAGIYSNQNPSNVHRIQNCMISVCDAGLGVRSQAYDSHVTEMYIFNCRVGLDFGAGAAAWSFNAGVRIEYIHEDGANLRTAHENDFSGIFFDTCGWSAIRALDCRNLLVTGCRFFRSGRNVRGIGTRLNPKANVEYSNHVWLEDCKRATFTGNIFDIGTKEGGDGIYLTDHFADNLRPSYGFRIHNTPELTVVGNNLTGCLQSFSGDLSDFGENDYHGWNIANNAQSDRELVALEVANLAKQEIYIPNNCFQIWQRDREFNLPVATDGNPTTFPIADGWFVTRGGDQGIDQPIVVLRGTDGKVGSGTYLHLEKPASLAFSDFQTLEFNNLFSQPVKYTSNRAIILSYYARSATNCSLGVKVSQYPDSPDNGFSAYQFQDNNRTLSSSWKRYQHYFELADLSGIELGDNALLNLIFRCDRALEDIDLDITGVQIDFADIAPFARELRTQSFADELAFARLRYQKSKDYEQYFPSWSDGYRYDVNGANWNPQFINQLADTTAGHSLKESVVLENPVLLAPGTGDSSQMEHLSILNPGQLTQQDSATKFNWAGLEEPPSHIDRANKKGFVVSARNQTITANGSYSAHWLYTVYDQDKLPTGGYK